MRVNFTHFFCLLDPSSKTLSVLSFEAKKDSPIKLLNRFDTEKLENAVIGSYALRVENDITKWSTNVNALSVKATTI